MRRIFPYFCALMTAFVVPRAFSDQPTTAPATQPEQSPPPPKRVAFIGNQQSVVLEVVTSNTGHLLVKPTINGKEAGLWFLDTGAGMNCIDTAFADELKLPVLREGEATGMGGAAKTRYRAIDTLALGPIQLEGSEAIELDLSSFEKFLGHKVTGIIGYDTFFAAIFEIDHRAAKVTVHDPRSFEPKDAEWRPIQLLDRRPSVEGSIEGHPSGLLMIDSGSNTGAVITSPTVKALDLLNGRETRTSMTGGVGGLHKQAAGTLEDITIGHTHLKHVDAIFSQSESGGTANEKYQAILGIPVLKQFVMIVDYPQKQIALKLNTGDATTQP